MKPQKQFRKIVYKKRKEKTKQKKPMCIETDNQLNSTELKLCSRWLIKHLGKQLLLLRSQTFPE